MKKKALFSGLINTGGIRKYLNIFLFLILLILIIYGYFWITQGRLIRIDSRRALPLRTVAFIESDRITSLIQELNSENKIWNELGKIEQLSTLHKMVRNLDNILKINKQLAVLLSNKITISLSLKSNKAPGLLFLVPVTVKNQRELVLQSFERNTKNFIYTRHKFHSYNIYDLNWSDSTGNRNFSFIVIKGLMVGSFSGELVEESILQMSSDKGLTDQDGFNEIKSTAGEKVSANIFINYRFLPELINYFSNRNSKLREDKFRDFADWGVFDMEFFSNRIILNGFTSKSDTIFRELHLFNGQDPVEFSSPSFLPSEVNLFTLYGFSDKELFFNQLSKKFEQNKNLKKLNDRKTALIKTYQFDVHQYFKEIIDNEYGTAKMPDDRGYFFMKLKSQSLAEEGFKNWINTYAVRNGLQAGDFYDDARIDNNTSVHVYKMPFGNIPSMIFGDSFESIKNDYFTFINNYIIFSDSFYALKYFIYQVILGNTISMDPSFSSLKEHISSLSNYFIYLKPYPSLGTVLSSLNEDLIRMVKTSREEIIKFNALTIQFTTAENILFNRIFINFSGKLLDNVNTIWESRIDTTINFKPAILINHNTGAKEIFIQDRFNQVYLLSNAGLILWKLKVDGPILSDIIQVDYFRNRKLQYLFNTSDRIYLLDRNGNNVEKYPIELRSKATTGMSVFDYDRDRTIRMCIPCEDRNIYMYDHEGKIIPGWKPDKTDNEILRPVQHFRIGDKDYIIAIDAFKFYIMDRKGNIRLKPARYFPVSTNNSFYLDLSKGLSVAGFMTTDTSGNVIKIFTNGKVEKILDQKLESDHFFLLADLNGDNKNEYIFTSGNEYFVKNSGGTLKFSQKIIEKIEIKPVIYKFSATDNKVGIVCNIEGIIYLYNNDGSLYRGFPLEGSSAFSISSFPELKGKFNLIVGSKNNFIYNYSVQ